jgi:hypothetical protein
MLPKKTPEKPQERFGSFVGRFLVSIRGFLTKYFYWFTYPHYLILIAWVAVLVVWPE